MVDLREAHHLLNFDRRDIMGVPGHCQSQNQKGPLLMAHQPSATL